MAGRVLLPQRRHVGHRPLLSQPRALQAEEDARGAQGAQVEEQAQAGEGGEERAMTQVGAGSPGRGMLGCSAPGPGRLHMDAVWSRRQAVYMRHPLRMAWAGRHVPMLRCCLAIPAPPPLNW